MAELKTKQNERSVAGFLKSIPDAQQREDSIALVKLLQEVTRKEPKMWGSSIVGFGSYHYKYESGHEGDSCIVGFSPRKQSLTLYIMSGFGESAALLKKLGKHKTGQACLYIKRLEDVDLPTLKKLVQQSVKKMSRAGS